MNNDWHVKIHSTTGQRTYFFLLREVSESAAPTITLSFFQVTEVCKRVTNLVPPFETRCAQTI